jgi:hypothetical protein
MEMLVRGLGKTRGGRGDMLPPPSTLLVASEFVDPGEFLGGKWGSSEQSKFEARGIDDWIHDDKDLIFFNPLYCGLQVSFWRTGQKV